MAAHDRLKLINQYIGGETLPQPALKKLETMVGPTEFKNITFARNYQKIDAPKFDKKLGEGQFGTVYSLQNNQHAVVKVTKHAVYDKVKATGLTEAAIIRHLNKTVNTLGIVRIFQYAPADGKDYLYLEKLNTTVWHWLAMKPTAAKIKSMIRQVLATLAAIQTKHPEFRHNDLKIDNVMLANGVAKIVDFDYACLRTTKNHKINSTYTSTFGCSSKPNKVYDVHIFLNSLWQRRKYLPKTVTQWIESKLPAETRGDDTTACKFGRLRDPEKWKGKIPIARELLSDPFLKLTATPKKAVCKTSIAEKAPAPKK